ncbi:MAG: hypothetical protein KGL95_07980 [Patescibacteria group bacterium]|nr:hypothetical protein [Patescibacteria group bacterium]
MSQDEPDLFCFFTSSTREGYEKTLRKIIQRTRGMSEMWIRPAIFEKIKDFVIDNYDAKIEGFLSISSLKEEEEARVRPNIKRRIHYRGKDGLDSIKELKEWYGVSPVSIDFVVNNFKFQITNEGLFTLKNVNETTFDIVDSILELIRREQIEQKDTAVSLKFEHDDDITKGASIESGEIMLPNLTLDVGSAKLLMDTVGSQFAFLDTYISAGSLDFSATVIDRHKGSMFDISADESKIVLIPRYQTTYESFLTFYRKVVETLDRKATFQLYS